jgi:competence protein ComEC
MTGALVSFAAGVLLLQLQPELPAAAWLWLGLVLVPIVFVSKKSRIGVALALGFPLGFLLALGMAHLRLDERLAPELEGRDIEVVGVVAGLPALMERGVRFEFEPEAAKVALPPKIILSWYRSPQAEDAAAPLQGAVHPGERWKFTVRLRRPHGQLNPHGFDYEAWLLERGIGATGYVRSRGSPLLLGHRNSFLDWIEKAREKVRDRFKAVLGETPASGILAALAVGDQRAISAEEWRLFNRTGVTHLMSISGLHVTMVSGLCAWLAGWLWRRGPRLPLLVPARKVGALAAIVGALGYTLIAGFAVPAQRTFWMVTVVALALWAGRITAPGRTLALALAVVLAFDPWAVWSAGFWLSFGAVALIFFVADEKGPMVEQWVRVQWAITIGLAPAVLFLFAQVSVAGPLANAVAIPVVSAVVTPIALVAAVLPWDALLELAAWIMQWQLQFLEWCAALPVAVWQQHAPPLWSTLVALLGVAWLLAPRGVPWRSMGLALMLPAMALPPPAPAPGEVWITTLDVGQGLATLVRTANRALLYDAGPAFGGGIDSGERVIAPYLRAAGIARLEVLVVTHHDLDHVGGAASVIENFEVGEMLSSLPAAHALHRMAPGTRPCRAGERWSWDGVEVAMLHPQNFRERKANNLSCVLKVSAGGRSMLLTGDIERLAEDELVKRAPQDLRADVLLVPHHGSRTSSSAEFLAAVQPRFAVAPVGYRNRFGHPNAEVLERYAGLGVQVFRTDRDGAVTGSLGENQPLIANERRNRRRYWHDAPS